MSSSRSQFYANLTRLRSDRRTWPVLVSAVLVTGALTLLGSGRYQRYFFDEQRLVAERVIPDPDRPVGWFQQLFHPDGEHMIGVTLALFVVLTRVFGIDT